MKFNRSHEREALLAAALRRIDELETQLREANGREVALRDQLQAAEDAAPEPKYTVRRGEDDAVLSTGLSLDDAERFARDYFWYTLGHPYAHVYDADGEMVWSCHERGRAQYADGRLFPPLPTATSPS